MTSYKPIRVSGARLETEAGDKERDGEEAAGAVRVRRNQISVMDVGD